MWNSSKKSFLHTKVLAVLSHITHYIKPLHDVCLDYIFLFWFAFWAMLQKVIMIPLIENGKPATMARSILKEHCLKLNISQNKKITKVAGRCIETDDCNFWSFVNKKNLNITLSGTCFLYSAINISHTINDPRSW